MAAARNLYWAFHLIAIYVKFCMKMFVNLSALIVWTTFCMFTIADSVKVRNLWLCISGKIKVA
jgi:hypothetical protein